MKFLRKLFGKRPAQQLPDLAPEVVEIARQVAPYTQTSIERISALCESVRYVVQNEIPGSFVECGVWRGGSMMAVAHMLSHLKDTSRELYLFDTFEGLTSPGEHDIAFDGKSATGHLTKIAKKKDRAFAWCISHLDEVQANMSSTDYPSDRIQYVRGRVEDTIPHESLNQIAILRLDTDWYESTKHELIHLYPSIAPGGVLIIDDYGHWQGARKAVDEYLQENNIPLLLNRIDYTGRVGVVRAQTRAA